jgi:signal transduction histidine kinase
MWEDNARVPEALRAEMAAVTQQTKSIVLEGRERIMAMRRTDAQPTGFVEALGVIGREAAGGPVPAFEVEVLGEPKTLTVEATEQLLDIAREAVRNACLHAAATRIAVTLEYRKRSLIMAVADDGRGFDPATAEGRAKAMHFGLVGMRERANQLGARLRIHSRPDMGTRIEVTVPAVAAFPDAFRWPWQRARPATDGAASDGAASGSGRDGSHGG